MNFRSTFDCSGPCTGTNVVLARLPFRKVSLYGVGHKVIRNKSMVFLNPPTSENANSLPVVREAGVARSRFAVAFYGFIVSHNKFLQIISEPTKLT